MCVLLTIRPPCQIPISIAEMTVFGEHSCFYCQEHRLENDSEDTGGLPRTDNGEEESIDVGDDGNGEGGEDVERVDGNDGVEMEDWIP